MTSRRAAWLNSLIFGAIVLLVWLWDFCYVQRYSLKLPISTISAANKISIKLDKDLPFSTFHSKSEEILYLTTYGFEESFSIENIQIGISKTFQKIFSSKSKIKIYIRKYAYLPDQKDPSWPFLTPEFENTHVGYQNIYKLHFIKSDDNFLRSKFKESTLVVFCNSYNLLNEIKLEEILGVLLSKVITHQTKGNLAPVSISEISRAELNTLKRKSIDFITSLNYIQNNQRLVFKKEYISDLKKFVINLPGFIENGNIYELAVGLELLELDIYESSYIFEEYL